MVPQPGHRPAAARHAARAEPAVAGRRLRRRGASSAGWLERTRSRDPDRRPSPATSRRCARAAACPGIVEADDLGTYVCKFRGAGQGVRVLVAEVIVGGLARRIGLATPRLVGARPRPATSPATRPTRRSRTCSTPARAQPRRRLPARRVRLRRRSCRRRGRPWPPGCSGSTRSRANVDRSWRNPNLLVWHGDLWVIDHGAALYFHHGWSGGSRRPERFAAPAVGRGRPRARGSSRRRAARRSTRRLRRCSTTRCSPRSLAEVPDAWLEPVPGAETPDALRAAYVALPRRPARHRGSGCPWSTRHDAA